MEAGATLPDSSDLVGAWELESWRISFSDDRPDTFPYGTDPRGYLIYSPSGRMSVTVSADGRTRMSDDNIRRAPVEEKAAAFDSFFHYGGRWRLEDDHMVHEVDIALNPNFVGTSQVRDLEWEVGRFTLVETSTTRSGATMRNQLTWRVPQP